MLNDLFASLGQFSAFFQVVLIDLSLAGDNAIIVGMAAAGLPAQLRHKAIFIGIIAATVLRIVLSLFTVQLLQIIGLTLAGGLLLLWVSWKMYKSLREQNIGDPFGSPDSAKEQEGAGQKKLFDVVLQIVVADVSMSLDNVLAVAGAAREHLWVMVVGLALSVVLMGAASVAIVKLLHRYRWIGYAGLLVVFYVALRMIWDGAHQVQDQIALLTP